MVPGTVADPKESCLPASGRLLAGKGGHLGCCLACASHESLFGLVERTASLQVLGVKLTMLDVGSCRPRRAEG